MSSLWVEKLANAPTEQRVNDIMGTIPIPALEKIDVYADLVGDEVNDNTPWYVVRRFIVIYHACCKPTPSANKKIAAQAAHALSLSPRDPKKRAYLNDILRKLKEFRFVEVRSAKTPETVCRAVGDLLPADRATFINGFGGVEHLTVPIAGGILRYVEQQPPPDNPGARLTIESVLGWRDVDGWTLLHWAARFDHAWAVERLEALISGTNEQWRGDFAKTLMTRRNTVGDTVFATAVRRGHVAFLEELVLRSATLGKHVRPATCGVDNKDHFGKTAEAAGVAKGSAVADFLRAFRSRHEAAKSSGGTSRKRQREDNSDAGGDSECTICLDRRADHALRSCGHAFCRPCLLQCGGQCPMCREAFTNRDLLKLHSSS